MAVPVLGAILIPEAGSTVSGMGTLEWEPATMDPPEPTGPTAGFTWTADDFETTGDPPTAGLTWTADDDTPPMGDPPTAGLEWTADDHEED